MALSPLIFAGWEFATANRGLFPKLCWACFLEPLPAIPISAHTVFVFDPGKLLA